MNIKINGSGMGAYLLANECISRGHKVNINRPIEKYKNPIIMLKNDLEEYGFKYSTFGSHSMKSYVFMIDNYKIDFKSVDNPFCYFNSNGLIKKVNGLLEKSKRYDYVVDTKGLEMDSNVCCYVYAAKTKNQSYIESCDINTFLAWYSNNEDYIIVDNKKYFISFEYEPNLDGTGTVLTFLYTIGELDLAKEQLKDAFFSSSFYEKIKSDNIEVEDCIFDVIEAGNQYPVLNEKLFGEAAGFISPTFWGFRSVLKNVKSYVDYLEGKNQIINKDAKYLFNIYLFITRFLALNKENINFDIFPKILMNLKDNNINWIDVGLAEDISPKKINSIIVKAVSKYLYLIIKNWKLVPSKLELIKGLLNNSDKKLESGFQYYKRPNKK